MNLFFFLFCICYTISVLKEKPNFFPHGEYDGVGRGINIFPVVRFVWWSGEKQATIIAVL